MTQKLNHLFGREEVEIVIAAEKTPSETEVEKIIGEKFSSNPENVRIRIIKGKFGSREFLVRADIYKNIEDKMNFGTIKKRNKRKKKGANAGGKK